MTTQNTAPTFLVEDGKVAPVRGEFDLAQARKASFRAGGNDSDFTLTLRKGNGLPDTSFGVNGTVTTSVGAGKDVGMFVAVQEDGKILEVGISQNLNVGFASALVRYNSNGSLDTSFDNDGIVTTLVGVSNFPKSFAVQTDGKILVVGLSIINGNNDIVLIRYNGNGSLDTSFGVNGVVTTAIGLGDDVGINVTWQTDGKILVVGSSDNGSNSDIALVRYNANGSLDTSFDNDGIVITSMSAGDDVGDSVTVLADGKILVTGSSSKNMFDDINTFDSFNTLIRYNSNGSLDTSFNARDTLSGIVNFTKGGKAVLLDSNVQVSDTELNASDYNGSSVSLARHGGANADDIFLSPDFDATNNNVVAYISEDFSSIIGTFTEANGLLTIYFNASASQREVNTALQHITYSNSSATPPASVKIDWTFNDGNTGAQGTGGALSTLGSTTVVSNVTAAVVSNVSTKVTIGNDQITGTAKAEKIDGLAGNDLLKGLAGNDTLIGGAGFDTLIGGAGADNLTGGTESDIFKFTALADSGTTSKARDTITDFKSLVDKIDLSAIDANEKTAGDQAFTFIGSSSFNKTNASGQLRFDATSKILYGSTDADTTPEFSIQLNGVKNLVAGDFIL